MYRFGFNCIGMGFTKFLMVVTEHELGFCDQILIIFNQMLLIKHFSKFSNQFFLNNDFGQILLF